MRASVRLVGTAIAVTGLMSAGSPAFAAADKDNHSSVTTAAAEGGKGGYGGNGGSFNFCPAIGLLKEAHAECGNGGSADGGDAYATAEDDSKDKEKAKDDENEDNDS
ncbi:hypothetical protein EIL87_06165 [Saccharopolyspora rhizosphaerae]|uniref:DUF320 domain-containing protein n=1 Tax=Saccharopolyspora rhizosphaerae TaxID=2492662 RepID=A0A426K018_9PSEU|nr:hypothetical protein [Saccharopolyspora rhizosphaerae]RRO18696.1 hypothetical protein EIL87_06165 [Saccharopolyspora rhizosphaerae]